MFKLDFILLLLIAFFAFRGFRRGVLISVVSLIGIIFALLMAFKFYHSASHFIHLDLGFDVKQALWISFFLVFFLVFGLILIMGILLKKSFSAIGIGLFDNFLGSILGLAQGVLVAKALYFLISLTSYVHEKAKPESVLIKHIDRIAPDSILLQKLLNQEAINNFLGINDIIDTTKDG